MDQAGQLYDSIKHICEMGSIAIVENMKIWKLNNMYYVTSKEDTKCQNTKEYKYLVDSVIYVLENVKERNSVANKVKFYVLKFVYEVIFGYKMKKLNILGVTEAMKYKKTQLILKEMY